MQYRALSSLDGNATEIGCVCGVAFDPCACRLNFPTRKCGNSRVCSPRAVPRARAYITICLADSDSHVAIFYPAGLWPLEHSPAVRRPSYPTRRPTDHPSVVSQEAPARRLRGLALTAAAAVAGGERPPIVLLLPALDSGSRDVGFARRQRRRRRRPRRQNRERPFDRRRSLTRMAIWRRM